MTIRRLGNLIVGAVLLLSLAGCVIHEHRGGGGGYRDRPAGYWRR